MKYPNFILIKIWVILGDFIVEKTILTDLKAQKNVHMCFLYCEEWFWLKFVCNSNQIKDKTCYKYIQYCVHWLTLWGKRKQALTMGRQGILLTHRITNLSNANARFSASINDNECGLKDGMLILQMTVSRTYFQIIFVKHEMEKKDVAMPSVYCPILDTVEVISTLTGFSCMCQR